MQPASGLKNSGHCPPKHVQRSKQRQKCGCRKNQQRAVLRKPFAPPVRGAVAQRKNFSAGCAD
jgi:hypothetical protein